MMRHLSRIVGLVYSNNVLPRSSTVCPGEHKHPRHTTRSAGVEGPTIPEAFWRSVVKDMHDIQRQQRASRRQEHSPKRGRCDEPLSEDELVCEDVDEEEENAIFLCWENDVAESFPTITCTRCRRRIAGQEYTGLIRGLGGACYDIRRSAPQRGRGRRRQKLRQRRRRRRQW